MIVLIGYSLQTVLQTPETRMRASGGFGVASPVTPAPASQDRQSSAILAFNNGVDQIHLMMTLQ
jgi:hypothetical protein